MSIMSIIETFQKALFEGYATSEINIQVIFVCIIFTTILATYIYFIYKMVNKNSFHNQSFSLSLIALSIITAAIILTIQSNIVVSLGMVGALSIVRFRTAIKEPLDLVFLFWSISVGIICGAGYAMIGIVASIIITIVIIVFVLLPASTNTKVLVISAKSIEDENDILETIKNNSISLNVRSKTATIDSLNMTIEFKSKDESKLLKELTNNKDVLSASIVEYDGNITA